MVGTGGTTSPVLDGPRPGDGSRNVRSDIEDELDLRSSFEDGLAAGEPTLERFEALEARRTMRFVWISATDVGVVGLDRMAAAAAAADREALEARLLRKAWAAATWAFALAPWIPWLSGYKKDDKSA